MNELITLTIMILSVCAILSVYATANVFYEKVVRKSKKNIIQIIDEI